MITRAPDLAWRQCVFGEGCKDIVSIEQTLQTKPAICKCQASLRCCALQMIVLLQSTTRPVGTITLQLCSGVSRPHKTSTRRSPVTPNEATRFEAFQHLTEFLPLVLLLLLERPATTVCNQALDINSVYRLGVLASGNLLPR